MSGHETALEEIARFGLAHPGHGYSCALMALDALGIEARRGETRDAARQLAARARPEGNAHDR